MKRVAFAWLTFWYDFDTKEEAEEFVVKNGGKGWQIKEPYDNGADRWTVVVEKPYSNYNHGW